MIVVLTGAQAPERVRLRVENAEAEPEPLDFGDVTAAEIQVLTPQGLRRTWSAEIIEQTSDHLIVEHVFALTDVEIAGQYRVSVSMTVSDGIRRAGPTVLQARE